MAAAAVMHENDEYEVNAELDAAAADEDEPEPLPQLQSREPRAGVENPAAKTAMAAGPAARFAETLDASKAKPAASNPKSRADAFQTRDKPQDADAKPQREGEMGDNDVYYWPDEEAAVENGQAGAAFANKSKK